MVDFENLRTTVVRGLKNYLNCPVIRNNQDAEPPAYPYVSYTVTTVMSENRGTYGKCADGVARKPVTQTWSITAQSNKDYESVMLANKAREWLDYVGTTYLNDNDVIVQSCTSVTNRDNVLTVGYEYKNGFDCFFWCYDEASDGDIEKIEEITLGEDLNDRLEARLDGVERHMINSAPLGDTDEENNLLEERLDGVM